LINEGPGHFDTFKACAGTFALLGILELFRESIQELNPDILDIIYQRIQSQEPVHCSVDPFIDKGALDVGTSDDDLSDPGVKFWDSNIGQVIAFELREEAVCLLSFSCKYFRRVSAESEARQGRRVCLSTSTSSASSASASAWSSWSGCTWRGCRWVLWGRYEYRGDIRERYVPSGDVGS
jgi:hypothetical protein